MLTKNEFMEGIHILQDNYNRKLTGDQLRLYYENLKDLSKEKYINNIKEIIKNVPYMPNIAQIRSEQKREVANYDQRDYSNFDFSKLYANKEIGGI